MYLTRLENLFTTGKYLLSFGKSFRSFISLKKSTSAVCALLLVCFSLQLKHPEVAHSNFFMPLQHEAEKTAVIRGSFAHNNRDTRGCLTDGMLLAVYGGIYRLH